MSTLRFGTDGLRGEANKDLTPEVALALGRSAAAVRGDGEWLVGWDTRLSSPMLASAFAAGIASAGGRVTEVDVLPTAGLAFMCRAMARPGAVVTASHNPYYDNGIKLFGSDGLKLSESMERRIEDCFARLLASADDGGRGRRVGDVQRPVEMRNGPQYQAWLAERASALDGSRLRIGLDCANGAASPIAHEILAATGASVDVIHRWPDGYNINDRCGSMHLAEIRALVLERSLDLGLAFDGDADRVVAVDETGAVLDGDSIMAILALERVGRNALSGNGVVATEWSNLGLTRSLRAKGVDVEVCAVGDRNVAARMRRTGYSLGGEQSGHVILAELLPVGDGISTAIELVAAITSSSKRVSELGASSLTKMPQGTENVDVVLPPTDVVSELETQVLSENESLGDSGRILLRASGTESVVRVMVEAEDSHLVSSVLARAVKLVAATGQRRL